MPTWNAEHYLRYADERNQAAADLVSRIKLHAPKTIFDLGCGPGNSTQILRARWPHADIVGIDRSCEMIAAARQSFPDQNWLIADASAWHPTLPADLVYSNAALHWLPRHESLIPHLFSQVASGGAFAFQIPSRTYPTIRKLIHDLSDDEEWTERMAKARNALTLETPAFYYDVLSREATDINIWETEYFHVFESKDSIVDWMASTGLCPFLEALNTQDEQNRFLKELGSRANAAYETRIDGKVLFPFRRLFVIAYR